MPGRLWTDIAGVKKTVVNDRRTRKRKTVRFQIGSDKQSKERKKVSKVSVKKRKSKKK